MKKINVFELEKKLIKHDDFSNYNIPKEVLDIYNDSEESGPTGIGYDDEIGFFILGSGQGPFLIWQQFN